jgi:DNA-binding NarL/FixJ family response regulator
VSSPLASTHTTTTPVRVVVAHRSTLIRDVLRLLGLNRDVYVVGEARTREELLDLCRSEQPGVVLCEANFDDGSDIESCLAELVASGARVAVICDDPSPERLTTILGLGASAYLRSDQAPTDVVDAVAAVAEGETVLEPWATATILNQWRSMRADAGGPGRGALPHLTTREAEILSGMAEGLPAKAIARNLGVAVKTVENHKIRIFDKLGVRTQAAAVSLAISHGLLTSRSVPVPAPPAGSN